MVELFLTFELPPKLLECREIEDSFIQQIPSVLGQQVVACDLKLFRGGRWFSEISNDAFEVRYERPYIFPFRLRAGSQFSLHIFLSYLGYVFLFEGLLELRPRFDVFSCYPKPLPRSCIKYSR